MDYNSDQESTNRNFLNRRIGLPLLFLIILIADQVSKILVQQFIPLGGERIHIIGNILNFVYIKNPFGAMGLKFGPPWVHLITSALATLIVGYIFIRNWLRNDLASLSSDIGMVLVLSGAIGNLLDKLLRGFVIDFIDIGFSHYRFWSFNIADAAITIGAILWILPTVIHSQHKVSENTQNLE
jgi:signal peptidase II